MLLAQKKLIKIDICRQLFINVHSLLMIIYNVAVTKEVTNRYPQEYSICLIRISNKKVIVLHCSNAIFQSGNQKYKKRFWNYS